MLLVNQSPTLQSGSVVVGVFVSVCFEHASWHPALGGGRVGVGRSVNKTLTLLVGRQNLDFLSPKHGNLVLPHGHKVLQHLNQLLWGSNGGGVELHPIQKST